MPSWLLPVLTVLLKIIPIGDILSAILVCLRRLATSTPTQLDDQAIDFIEMVFIEMGLISKSASYAAVPVTSKVTK